jgi:hypothetical protein
MFDNDITIIVPNFVYSYFTNIYIAFYYNKKTKKVFEKRTILYAYEQKVI